MLAGMMHDEKAAAGIKALAPAVICVGCLSAFRGYSQGHSNMTPTAVSQIIEALCKLVVGLGLAYWLVKGGATEDVAAAGAITGVTVGTIVALAYMVLSFINRHLQEHSLSDDVPDDAATILKNILRIAIPITLSSSMVGIVTVIDSSLVQGQLQKVLLENPDSWKLYQEYVDFAPLEAALTAWKQGLDSGVAASYAALAAQVKENIPAALTLNELVLDVSRTLYGNYSGALNIYNLPTSLMAAVTASVIPAVSAALTRRNRKGAARVSGSALRITALLAFPMGIGLNGAGKSTLARCICGLEKKCGLLQVDGKTLDWKARLKHCYMVMQDTSHQLFTESVMDEVLLSMDNEDETVADEILKQFDLLEYKDRHPLSLSGGQKQRVAIASAIVSNREIIVFDEPTSGLDLKHMREVARSLKSLADQGKTLLVITHDPELVMAGCSYVVHMEKGQIKESYPLDESGSKKVLDFFRIRQ